MCLTRTEHKQNRMKRQHGSTFVFVYLICTGLFHFVDGFGRGAPSKTCLDGVPHHHGGQRQISTPPYIMELNRKTYAPNDPVKVTLRSVGSTPFRGFQVRAHRLRGNTESIVGTFSGDPTHGQSIHYYPEVRGTKNCISHNDSEDKTLVTAEWIAPPTAVGDVVLVASFVKDFDTFWTGITQVLTSDNGNDDSFPFPYETIDKVDPISLSTCGEEKGCFRWPTGCSAEDCDYGVTWKNLGGNDGYYQFEMFGTASEYLALGLSHDIKMGDDHVIACVVSPKGNMVQNQYCPGQYCSRHLITNIVSNQVAKTDGKIYCRFQRPAAMTLKDRGKDQTFDLDMKNFYLFLGWGPLYEDSDSLMHHEQLPLVSYNKVDFTSTNSYYGQQLPLEMKIHVTFGAVGWLLFVGFSILVARHGKQILGADCCGNKAWLRTHQICMVFGFVLSAVSIVIVFVYVSSKDEEEGTIWTEYATVHAILGLVATGIALMQFTAGLARPNPDAKYRKIWTWLHRLGGVTAFIVSGVCVVLGFNVQLIEDVLRYRQTIITLVWIVYHVVFDFVFELVAFKGATKGYNKSEDDSQLKVITSSTPQKVAFTVYVIGLLILTALSVTLVSIV